MPTSTPAADLEVTFDVCLRKHTASNKTNCPPVTPTALCRLVKQQNASADMPVEHRSMSANPSVEHRRTYLDTFTSARCSAFVATCSRNDPDFAPLSLTIWTAHAIHALLVVDQHLSETRVRMVHTGIIRTKGGSSLWGVYLRIRSPTSLKAKV